MPMMFIMPRELGNAHTLSERVNVTKETIINFYDMKTLHYLVIKDKFE